MKNVISLNMNILVHTLTIPIFVRMYPPYLKEQLSKCAFVNPFHRTDSFFPRDRSKYKSIICLKEVFYFILTQFSIADANLIIMDGIMELNC